MEFDDYEMPEKEVEFIVMSMIEKAKKGDVAAAQWLEDQGLMLKLRGKYKHQKRRKVFTVAPQIIPLGGLTPATDPPGMAPPETRDEAGDVGGARTTHNT